MRIVGVAALLAVIVMALGSPDQPARAEELVISVTNTADVLETAACPSASDCTLRKAIETVNADPGTGPYVIVFDAVVLPVATPASITIGADDLPAITRDAVTVTGVGAGVILQGGGEAGVGLTFENVGAVVRGLHVQTFLTACIVLNAADATVGGDPESDQGNTLGSCVVGVVSSGAGLVIDGNVIGWHADGTAGLNSTGIESSGAGAQIGTEYPNVIGKAQTGIFSTGESAVIEQNTIGMGADGAAAEVGVGISSLGAGAVIGNSANTTEANVVGNATTGIYVAGAMASLYANVVGFAPDEVAAPVVVGVEVVGEDAVLGQDGSSTRGNTVGNADTGFVIRGAGATLLGNAVGVSPAGEAAPVEVGFAIEADDVVLGDEEDGENANEAGNADVGIRVGTGDGEEELFEGVRLERNWIGVSPSAVPHPVGTGIELMPPGLGGAVIGNRISNTTGAGIALTSDAGVNASAIISGNIFDAIGTLSVDLVDDGIRNPNDANDSDTGPNGLLNHPVILVATQAEIAGATGPMCVGSAGLCTVTLYNVEHTPGGVEDFATTPVPGGVTTTAANGSFEFDVPPVAAGKWITASVTLGEIVTSEFGPSARVGMGSVTCGNVQLFRGWNHAPYFGSEPEQLGLTFPVGDDDVSAIHELEDGDDEYDSWFAGTVAGRTLSTLIPGMPYWYYAESGSLLDGGFAVTVPVEVELEEGWNDFVYLGATVAVEDALTSLEGQYTSVYRYVNNGFTERWSVFGGPGTPSYVRDFDTMTACSTYWIYATEDVTLVPPHP